VVTDLLGDQRVQKILTDAISGGGYALAPADASTLSFEGSILMAAQTAEMPPDAADLASALGTTSNGDLNPLAASAIKRDVMLLSPYCQE